MIKNIQMIAAGISGAGTGIVAKLGGNWRYGFVGAIISHSVTGYKTHSSLYERMEIHDNVVKHYRQMGNQPPIPFVHQRDDYYRRVLKNVGSN